MTQKILAKKPYLILNENNGFIVSEQFWLWNFTSRTLKDRHSAFEIRTLSQLSRFELEIHQNSLATNNSNI